MNRIVISKELAQYLEEHLLEVCKGDKGWQKKVEPRFVRYLDEIQDQLRVEVLRGN